jgi:hypothetical protein
MNTKGLRKHIIYLESRNDTNLKPYSDEAKTKIKQKNKAIAKKLRLFITKTK